MNKVSAWWALMVTALMVLSACSEAYQPTPRPRGFPRMDLPEHSYVAYNSANCPFSFEMPAYGKLTRTREDSCVLDIAFPQFDARWHVTYRNIPASGQPVEFHREEHRKLVFKHIQKVSQIQEEELKVEAGEGIMYKLYGSVGTPAQLFVADSSRNALIAAFYFDAAVENDSLSPAVDFLMEDLMHMASTLKWNTGK